MATDDDAACDGTCCPISSFLPPELLNDDGYQSLTSEEEFNDDDDDEQSTTTPPPPRDLQAFIVDDSDEISVYSSSSSQQSTASTPPPKKHTSQQVFVLDDSSDDDSLAAQPLLHRTIVDDDDSSDDSLVEATSRPFKKEEISLDDDDSSSDDDDDSLLDTAMIRLKDLNIGTADDFLVSSDNDEKPVTKTKGPKPTPSKTAFARKRDSLAQHYFTKFDRHAFGGQLQPDTTVVWSNRLLRTAGLTRLRSQGSKRVAVVELATKVLDNETRLQQTLLHELCHAAAWLVDGISKPPHGSCFQKWAKSSSTTLGIPVTVTHSYEISYKYSWKCVQCDHIYRKHSKSIDETKHVCGKCRGRLEPQHATRALNAYNRFVQEQAPLVRKQWTVERRTFQSGDVMKECARLWRLQKDEDKENVS